MSRNGSYVNLPKRAPLCTSAINENFAGVQLTVSRNGSYANLPRAPLCTSAINENSAWVQLAVSRNGSYANIAASQHVCMLSLMACGVSSDVNTSMSSRRGSNTS